MLRHVAIAAAAMALAITAAQAQLATTPNVVTGTTSTGAPIYSAVGNGTGGSVPMPVTLSSLRNVAGPMQINVALTTATALTVPPNTTLAVIQADGVAGTENHCLRWRDDGTAPTATTGMAMNVGDTLNYSVVGFPIQLINANGATCTITVAYYF